MEEGNSSSLHHKLRAKLTNKRRCALLSPAELASRLVKPHAGDQVSSMCTVATAADHGNKSMKSAKIGGIRHVAGKTDIGQFSRTHQIRISLSHSASIFLSCSWKLAAPAQLGRI